MKLRIETSSAQFHSALVCTGLPADVAAELPQHFLWGEHSSGERRGRFLWVSARGLESAKLTHEIIPIPDSDVQPFSLHPWVGDDIVRALPHFVIRDHNNQAHRTHYKAKLVWANTVGQCWHLFSPLADTHFVDVWAYIESDSPVIRFDSMVTLKGREIMEGRLAHKFKDLHMVSGEPVVIDGAPSLGVREATRLRSERVGLDLPYDLAWVRMLSGEREVGRCQALQYSGHVLCTSQTGNMDPGGRWGQVFSAIAGGITRPRGWVDGAWDGKWGAFGKLPEYPTQLPPAHILTDAHEASRLTRGDIYDQTSMGAAKNAGTTGAQEDHGATQDCVLAAGNPLRLNEMTFCLRNYALRGNHNIDEKGRPVAASDHPGCATWSQIPDPRNGSDLLGWPDPWPYSWPGSGYTTFNGQHWSDELLTAVGRCEDSELVRRLSYDQIQMALAMVPWHPNAARARGRQLDSWADHLILLREDPDLDPEQVEDLHEHIESQVALYYQHWLGRTMPNADMRPIDLSSDPSLQQHRVRAVIIWQHSIFARGAYGVLKALESHRHSIRDPNTLSKLHEMIDAACDIVVRYGCGQNTSGDWHCFTSVRWDEGRDTVGEGDGSQNREDYVVAGGVWWDWILPGHLIYLERNPTGEHADRAREVVRAVRGDGPPKTQQQSEWEACVTTPIADLLAT